MHNHPKVKKILGGLVIILLIVGAYILGVRKPAQIVDNTQATTTPTTPAPTPVPAGVSYKNPEYGFSMALPETWEGYTVIEDEWEGDSLDATGQVQVKTQSGPLFSIRHPDWEYKSPRQDVPIMVFTIAQWNDLVADRFHIGAAPVGPSELGRNAKYVFAIPARYNFAYLIGYEEVDQIIRGDNFKAF